MTLTTDVDLRKIIREPSDTYHARAKEHLSSHALGDFRRCPALYRKKQLGLIPRKDSDAFVVGRAAHLLILEGRGRFEAEFAVGGPVNPKTGLPYGSGTKAFAEWAERLGKPALSDADAALIEEMSASVRGHAIASSLLEDGVAARRGGGRSPFGLRAFGLRLPGGAAGLRAEGAGRVGGRGVEPLGGAALIGDHAAERCHREAGDGEEEEHHETVPTRAAAGTLRLCSAPAPGCSSSVCSPRARPPWARHRACSRSVATEGPRCGAALPPSPSAAPRGSRRSARWSSPGSARCSSPGKGAPARVAWSGRGRASRSS